MRKSIVLAILCVACLSSALAVASPPVAVTFNDAALLDAVKTQWEAQTGGTLSDPPLSSELSNPLFTTLIAHQAGILDLTGLEACTSLTKLDLSVNWISSLTPIAGLTGLTYLDVGSGDLDDGTIDMYAAETNNLDDAAVTIIGGLTGLTYLNMEGNSAMTTLAPLTTLTSLEKLWIGNCTYSSFAALASLSGLTWLGINWGGFTNADVPSIAGLTGLQVLYLVSQDGLTDISGLSTLVNLQGVAIGYCPITDVDVFSNFTGLVQTDLSGSNVTNLDGLAGLASLSLVIAQFTQLTDISGLGGSTSLSQLLITDSPLVDISPLATDTALAGVFLYNDQITDISALVSNTGVGDDSGDSVIITNDPLSETARCVQIPALALKMSSVGASLTTDAICGPMLSLSVTNGPGRVFPEAGYKFYDAGTTVDLTAYPISDSGQAFDHWSGDLSSENLSESILMDADKVVSAVFAPGDHTLSLTSDGPGAIYPIGADGNFSFLDGRTVTLTALNNPGTYFLGWTGAVTSSSSSIDVTMDADKTLVAHFGSTAYSLTIDAPSGNGTTNPPTGTYYYSAGEVTVIANPDPGWEFSGWVGDIGTADPTNPTLVIDMNRDYLIQASFTQIMHDLTVYVDGSGTVNVPPGVTVQEPEGSTFTLVATPNDGWHFDHWDGLVETTATVDLLITQDYVLTAVFVQNSYTLTMLVDGTGTTNPAPGDYTDLGGTTFSFTAVQTDSQWLFDHWSGDIGSADPTASTIDLVLDSDLTVTAVFTQIPPRVLLITTEGSGTTSPEAGVEHSYTDGDVVILTATADYGWQFSMWSGDIGSASSDQSIITLTMDQDRAVVAHFTELPVWDLVIAVSGSGTTDPAAGAYQYPDGTVVSLTAIPDSGASFTRWEGDLGSADPFSASINLVMDASRSVVAVFSSGEGEGEGEGGAEGEGEGEGTVVTCHTADQDCNNQISLTELLRIIQFFNSGGYHCATGTEDGFAPGISGDHTCTPHMSDYSPQDWMVNLSELLRLIQFFNSGGYHACPDAVPATEDGFCVGLS